MLKANSRWKLRVADEEKAHLLEKQLKIDPLVAKLLVMRGIETVEDANRFLFAEKVTFHDPFLLDGMEWAVERIKLAISKQEKILIFGDYDADGVSSTSVLLYTLQDFGADVEFYIPNRFTEGYGPNEAAFRWAKSAGFSLIITVDTGISAIHEAAVAKELGLDYIITDHHEPQPELPKADVIIHPLLSENYPFKALAGVGVAFKLAHALYGKVPEHLLEFAVIGTIADLVPLVEENRLIASKGIALLSRSNKPGIRALLKVCSLEGKAVTAENVGFSIGPRINAVGRLSSADSAVHLLMSTDIEEAEDLANEIDGINKERQQIVNDMTEEAFELIDRSFPLDENKVLVIAKEGWNAGVIGIVASRIVEKYYRPTIVLSIDEEKGLAKGSARSIEGFDLFANLSRCKEILPHFGGHPMAAGMTLNVSDVDELRNRLNMLASEQLTEEDYIPVKHIDLACSISEVSLDTIEQLARLAPFGVQNPAPKVMLNEVNIQDMKTVGANQNHIKVTFSQNEQTLDAIGFQKGYIIDEISPLAPVSVVGELSINEWNSTRKPQLMLEDIAVSSWQLFDLRGSRKLQDKLRNLDEENVALIAFQEQTLSKLDLQMWHDRTIVLDSSWENTVKHNNGLLKSKFVILLDLPQSVDMLKNVLQAMPIPERIYSVFYHEEEHYFATLPTRDHFTWFYGFLLKRKHFNLKEHAEKLAKHKGWSKETVYFMAEVFFELEFVKIENGLLTLQPIKVKRDLSESTSYQQKKEKLAVENELCYSSYRSLMQFFEGVYSPRVREEEEIKNGL
jgi:single-stranded-DNA-specific exonuclease